MNAGPGAPPTLHVRATVLPGGEKRDVYVAGGLVVDAAPADAVRIDGSWVLPGLADAHSHVGMGPDGAVPRDVAEQQALTDRDAGALLLRDAGSAADTRWMDDRADLPRIVRAGRHIARPMRYLRGFAAEIDPADLVDEVRRQARAGDGWVKLVGDWIDRRAGDLMPLWPVDVLTAAVAAAHEEGARVTAHTFTEQAVTEMVAAGVDGIEHGTGLTDAVIDDMARRQVALVPTRLQIETFPAHASTGENRFPIYASHMRALYQRADATLRAAYEAGVPMYAGTDAGGALPHGLIADEVEALVAKVGMAPLDAVAAASWSARDWLGLSSGLAPGDPADFVVYDHDPRLDPRVLRHPHRIVLRGVVVR
jgi:imidazolonepropionase-like amidohydrolase